MVVRLWFVAVLVAVLPVVPDARGQDVPLLDDPEGAHRDTVDLGEAPPYRLRPWIIASTFRLFWNTTPVDSAAYRLDAAEGLLYPMVDTFRAPGVLEARYLTFPFDIQRVYRRNIVLDAPPDSVEAPVAPRDGGPAASGATSADDWLGTSRLQRSGSITRGIVAGNARDVSVESGLRLQLEGEIVDGVDVQAVLTDENTPIQPEGTTQRLSDFDRVYIQLQSRVGTAQLGDFDLQYTDTEFAVFNRKLQGATVFGTLPGREASFFTGGAVSVAGAASRGLFRIQEIEPIDGVQGPYRLEGAQGEQFILVVAGSEVVYLDGQRMVRGETNDYVIDYATGEITFTSHRIITSDRRLSVEFQYTTNEFSRTLLGAHAEAGVFGRIGDRDRAHFGVTFLREADAREFNDAFGFTREDSLLVVDAGDGPAQRSGAERVTFDPEAPYVQYTLETRDADDGGVDTVFVALASAPPDSVPVYRVRFTRVGPGQGRYARTGRSVNGVVANGIVFEYRGAGLGDYEPVRLLPKPKNQNLLDLQGRIALFKGVEVFGEWARSFNDENRLSGLDARDDIDSGYLSGVRLTEIPIPLFEDAPGYLSGEVRRRYTGPHFTTFNRTRPVEFARLWNLQTRTFSATGGVERDDEEITDEAFLSWNLTPASRIRGEVGRLDLGATFDAVRRAVEVDVLETALPQLRYRLDVIESDDRVLEEDGRWLRQQGRLARPLLGGRLVPSLEVEQERRRQRVTGTDSLARGSLAFVETRPGLSWTTERLEIGGTVEWRTEEAWAEGTLRDAARAWTVQSDWAFRPSSVFSIDAGLGYRVRRFTDYFRIQQQQTNTEAVLVRWETQVQPWRRAVDFDVLYEAQTERTPILQEIYLRSGPELGQFVWEDTNEDGLVQLDEFIPERTPNEGTYIKSFVPSDSLASIIGVRARVRLNLEPARLWTGPQTGLRRFLSGVATRTLLEVQEKSRDEDLTRIYLLDLSRYRDPLNTLNGRLRIAQDVFLFRRSRRVGVDLSFNQLRSLTELSAGQEDRFTNQWRAEARLRAGERWGFRLVGGLEEDRLLSETFASRQYAISGSRLEPEVSFTPTQAVQLTAGLAWARKDERLNAREARLLRAPLEVRFARARRLQLVVRGEAAWVRIAGADAVGLALFELTDGRGPGTSFLWGVSGDYAFSSVLRLSFTYDGRAPSGAPTVHTLRVQMSALF